MLFRVYTMQPDLPSVLNETMDLVFNVCIMMYMYIIITLSLNKVMMKQHLGSGSSAAEFEILYCHLIMRILMSTFRCIDNIDYVIMYRHFQKDNFHLFSLIWLMWLLKIRL